MESGHLARQLKVGYVLEGSVRKSGNRIRITAKLIDGATGGHLWAERFDRALEFAFSHRRGLARMAPWNREA